MKITPELVIEVSEALALEVNDAGYDSKVVARLRFTPATYRYYQHVYRYLGFGTPVFRSAAWRANRHAFLEVTA